MYAHSTSVFNNNCLKLPRNPKSDHPLPVYEQKYLNQIQNQATKDFGQMKSGKCVLAKNSVKSFIEFYDSIPEYDEINHLSNREFYKKLENLKEKQKKYCEYLRNEIRFEVKDTEWVEDYKKIKIGDKGLRGVTTEKKKKPSIKPFCVTPVLNKNVFTKSMEDEEFFSVSDKEILSKPPSRRSVRIETPSEKLSQEFNIEPHFRSKSRANLSSAGSKGIKNVNEWDDLDIDDLNFSSDRHTPLPMETRSAPNSPSRSKNNNDGITIPKPFQMTVRDEENKIVEELFLKVNKPKEEKPELFKAHDIPIESQIPLFDKIMADQERRSNFTKQRRKAALQAQMKPFSFTKRDEEIQELSRQFSKSLPCIYYDEVPLKVKKFKAKPIPKNLFSNYIYKKMHEDEFYRALQKKVRAEEMLRAASLPPSMAKREKSAPKFDVCPRSFRQLSPDDKTPNRKPKKIPSYKEYYERFEKELEELKNEFISTSPRPFKFKTAKHHKKKRIHMRNSSASSKSSSDARTPSSLDMTSLNRSNLAEVLRVQSARRRLEIEMMQKLEEAKLKEDARWREKLMRKKPVWQTLAFSHEEDLAMRLQLRRDEEKLRNEEHKLRMQLMLGRVNQQPTLFERQSQITLPKTREELANQLRHEYRAPSMRNPKKSVSDLSDTRSPSLVEMKDEAIQAAIDDSPSYGNRKRSEEKEKSEYSSSDDNDKVN